MSHADTHAHSWPLGVSICCITYNQADYIAETIESFLAQKTSFPYEILIHDDCSTDGTTEILRAYEEKYPNTVRVVYEESNQWNPSVRYIAQKLLPIARYRYFAQCEGDDRWCAEDKLERQLSYLEEHPECSMTVHNARIVNGVTGEDMGIMGYGDTSKDVDQAYVLAHWATPDAIPTASAVCRREIELRYDAEWNFPRYVGDLCRTSYFAGCGYIHHDPMVASIYRSGTPGSFSSGFSKSWVNPQREMAALRFFADIDSHTGFRHHEQLMRKGAMPARTLAAVVGIWRFFSSELGRPYLRYLSLRDVVLGLGTRAVLLAGANPAFDHGRGRTVLRRQTPEEWESLKAFCEAFDGRGGESTCQQS